jgi:hypothetical protein
VQDTSLLLGCCSSCVIRGREAMNGDVRRVRRTFHGTLHRQHINCTFLQMLRA